MANDTDMSGWTDLLHSSSKLVEQAAPSAQFPPLQRNLDQLESLSNKLKAKTLRAEAPSHSIAATRLLAREGLNAEQLARDLRSFELKTTFEDVFPAEATTVEEYLKQSDTMEVQEEGDFYRGSDEECVNYSDEDDQLCNYPSATNAPKLQFRKDKSIASWIEELGMAQVIENKGKLWTTIGITRAAKTYLSLEEIVYLAEIGALDLLSADGKAVALSDVYGKLAENSNGCRVSWDLVEVYRHLKSLGYIVGRHGIPWSLKNCNLENGTSGKGMVDDSSIAKMFRDLHFGESRPIYDVYPPNSKFKKSAPGSPLFMLFPVSGQPPSNQEIKHLEACYSGSPLKFCTVDHGRVSYLSYTRVELPVLP